MIFKHKILRKFVVQNLRLISYYENEFNILRYKTTTENVAEDILPKF